MDAVVDADADEGDDREEREQIQLDAGERQQPGRPHQADRGRQQREQRQPPVAERRDHEHDDDRRANREPLDELRQEPARQLAG